MKQLQGGLCASTIGCSSSIINTNSISSNYRSPENDQYNSLGCISGPETQFIDNNSKSEGECSSGSDSENNWDFGIGDLVTDLDADIERNGGIHGNATVAKGSYANTDLNYNSRMSSTTSGPLKMKILKNPKGAVNVTNSTITTADGGATSAHTTNVGNKGSDIKSVGDNVSRNNKTGKQPATERVSSKSRSTAKKVAKSSKATTITTCAAHVSTTHTYVTSCVTTTSSVSTASGSVCNVTNSSLSQRTPHIGLDPYAFSSEKFEDRMAMAGKKAMKVDKVRV